jgi:hypothetical protein
MIVKNSNSERPLLDFKMLGDYLGKGFSGEIMKRFGMKKGV